MTEEDSEAMSTSSLPNFKSLGMDYMVDGIFSSHNDIACSSRMEQMPYLVELQGHKTVVLSGTFTHFKDFNEDARQLLKNGPFEEPKGVFKKLDKFPIVSTETSNYIENEHYQVISKIERTMMEICSDNRSKQKFTRQRIPKEEFGSDTLEAILSMQGTCEEIPELLGIITNQDWVELFWNFEGVTVAEFKNSQKRGKLSEKESILFLKQCLRFGCELEKKGICFQYINPGSVFVVENGYQLKFADFSLATFARNKKPYEGWYMKKLIRYPECASPEICRLIWSKMDRQSHYPKEYMDCKSDAFMLALFWISLTAGRHASQDSDRLRFIGERAEAGKLELGEKGDSVIEDILWGMTQCVEQRLSAQDALKRMNECDDSFLMSRKDVPLFGEQAAPEVLGRLKSFVQGTIPIENQGVKRPISPTSYVNDLAPQTKGLKKENEPQSLKYSYHGDQLDVSLGAGQREGPPLTHERESHQIENFDEIPEPILEISTLKILGQNQKEKQGDSLCSSQNTGTEHPCMGGDGIQISTDSDAKSETKYSMNYEDNPIANASDQKDEDISFKLRNCLPGLDRKSVSSSGSDMEDVCEQAVEEGISEEELFDNIGVFDSVLSQDYTQDRHKKPPDPPALPADKNGSTGKEHTLQAPFEPRLKLARQENKSGIEKDNKSSASTVSPFQHHDVLSSDVHTDAEQPSTSTNWSLMESRQMDGVVDNIFNDDFSDIVMEAMIRSGLSPQ